MCLCCCPPAINALFCLWVRSGFSKASVAGALTFFPPDPAFYKFQRLSRNGDFLPDDYKDQENDNHDDDNDNHDMTDDEIQHQQRLEEVLDEDDEQYDSRHGTSSKRAPKTNQMNRGDSDSTTLSNTTDTPMTPRFSAKQKTTGITPTPQKQRPSKKQQQHQQQQLEKQRQQQKKQKQQQQQQQNEYYEEQKETAASDPAKALTDRAVKLRQLAKIKNSRDAYDHANGVTYRLEVDPRLQSSHMPRFNGTVEAVKIGPQPKTNNYVAAVLYRLSADRTNKNTKTIIYSHGNATDIGAMNLMQCLLAKGLRANVLMYDYSGYGASGGVPLEANTYRDIKLVYQWVTDNVTDGDESKIIVYGQSVGSGPSCYICKKRQNVGGLILHSPFMSGMRVLTPSR